MREVWVTDDVTARDLTPERCAAARAILGWSREHLAGMVKAETGHGLTVAALTGFEDYREALGHLAAGNVAAVLSRRVEFTTEGEPGVVCKPEVWAERPPGFFQFGGRRKRRQPL